ncbi:MAG: hypothetical protein ACC628_01180, partial [Pirellulaceae bacterium]
MSARPARPTAEPLDPTTALSRLATMMLPAAQLAAEIHPARVAGMRQEAYATVATLHRAVLQARTMPQDG